MSLHITPAMMEASYELLRTTPPFRGWKLPPGEEVAFKVIHCNDRCGDYERLSDGTHCIRANAKWIGSIWGLLRLLAHEMIHLRQQIACPNDQSHHGTAFLTAAKTVCRYHLLDPKAF